MSIFMCELCDQLKDADFKGCYQWEDGLVCEDCHVENTPEDYEDWVITYEKKPIPSRQFDWEATHIDYDGAPIHSGGPPADARHFTGPSLQDVWLQVIEYNEEEA